MARSDSSGSDKSLIGGIVSLFFPGLGLLLTEDKKVAGVAMFVCAMIVDFVVLMFGAIGTFLCVIGFLLWLIIPIVHVAAAIYTYDSIKKAQGEAGLIFN
ncbi:MAG: hypothetical protein WC506_00195 [Candidatus Micrarchaeia archaeon]